MMTRRILKWNVPVDDREHPVGSGPVVHVGCQGDPSVVQVWTDELVDDDTLGQLPSTTARVYGTGQPLPPYSEQRVEVVGSTIAGPLVWHVLRRWSS